MFLHIKKLNLRWQFQSSVSSLQSAVFGLNLLYQLINLINSITQ